MADLALDWNGDFSLSASGDMLLADDGSLVQQRIQRRLFTAEQDYLWHLEYGAGLPQKIGSTFQPYRIESIVRAQMALEASVSQNPPPKIAVTQSSEGLQVIRVDYVDATSGQQIGLTISI